MTPRKVNIIAYSVFIIIALLLVLGSCGVIKGPDCKSVAICLIFVTAGSWLLYSVYSAIRRGMISVGAKGRSVTTYTFSQQRNPVAFWFFIVLILTFVLTAFSVGAYLLFHPPTH